MKTIERRADYTYTLFSFSWLSRSSRPPAFDRGTRIKGRRWGQNTHGVSNHLVEDFGPPLPFTGQSCVATRVTNPLLRKFHRPNPKFRER